MHNDGRRETETYFSRWIILASCIVFMTLSGNVYGFGLVSDDIKSRLGLSQLQLDIVATMGNIGGISQNIHLYSIFL